MEIQAGPDEQHCRKNEELQVGQFLETIVKFVCLAKASANRASSPDDNRLQISANKKEQSETTTHLQKQDFDAIIALKNTEIDKLKKYCEKIQGVDVAKMQNYIVKLTELCNSKTSQLNAVNSQLVALKSSKSSSIFITKLNSEVEAHHQTKAQYNEVQKKYSLAMKELNNLKAVKIQELSKKLNNSGANNCEPEEKDENLRNDDTNVNHQNKNQNVEQIENFNLDDLDPKVLQFIENQIESKNEALKKRSLEIENLKQQIDDYQNDLEAVQFQYTEILRFSDTTTSENVKLNQKLDENMKKMNYLLSKVNQLSGELNKQRIEFKISEENFNKRINTLSYENQELKLKNSELESQVVANIEQCKTIAVDCTNESERADAASALTAIHTDFDNLLVENLKYDLRQKQKLIKELLKQIADMKTKLLQSEFSRSEIKSGDGSLKDDELIIDNKSGKVVEVEIPKKVSNKNNGCAQVKEDSSFFIEKINDLKQELKLKNK
ncbi:MAG: hypothetical protein MHMPM18_001185 [Marteilia pararefringens]